MCAYRSHDGFHLLASEISLLKKTSAIFYERKMFVCLEKKETERDKVLIQKFKCNRKVQCENHCSHMEIHIQVSVPTVASKDVMNTLTAIACHTHRSIHTSQLMQRETLFYAFTCSENILVETHTSLYVFDIEYSTTVPNDHSEQLCNELYFCQAYASAL